MNLTITSKVKGDLEWVYSNFDEKLFGYLLPPGAKLIAFGGSVKGAIVHLKLPLAGEWLSEIIEDKQTDSECYFIDVGRKLPFPLKRWRHKHLLLKKGELVRIEDQMTFSSGYLVLDLIMLPMLWLSFLPRKWQYQGYFNQLK
ncbi:MAG: hypothetical protein RLO81_08845 [Fulvivirga sp.]|uniref:hypothetical protein n=1 Tax=Fulvivirga sp. TaxID=1931237 RepID=UPI0032EAC661